jgi:hypothetical protein
MHLAYTQEFKVLSIGFETEHQFIVCVFKGSKTKNRRIVIFVDKESLHAS